eukprot:scaffold61353_cov82-Cyclotella_meneghiniana.AAC.2
MGGEKAGVACTHFHFNDHNRLAVIVLSKIHVFSAPDVMTEDNCESGSNWLVLYGIATAAMRTKANTIHGTEDLKTTHHCCVGTAVQRWYSA